MTKMKQKLKKQWPAVRKEVLPWALIFFGNMIIFGWVFAYLEGMTFWQGFFTGPYFGVVTGTTTGFGDVLPHHYSSGALTMYLSTSSWALGLITAAKMVEVLVKNPHLYSHAEQEREERKANYNIAMNEAILKHMGIDARTFPEYTELEKALEAVEKEEKDQ